MAATRVETTRDLLVNWNFFIETKVAFNTGEFFSSENDISVANVSNFLSLVAFCKL